MSDLKELSAFVVFDEDGVPQFCAPTASMCHDHINDAISADIDDASKWIVRRLGHTQHSHELPGWVAYLKEAHEQSLDGLESDSRATLLFVIEQIAARPAAPLATDAGAAKLLADPEIDWHLQDAFKQGVEYGKKLAAHPAAERPAQGEVSK